MNELGFALKKLIGDWIMPFPAALTVLLLGCLLLWLGRGRVGRALVTLGVVLLLVFSAGGIAPHLIFALERQYPKFSGHIDNLGYVVVMGATYSNNVRLPLTNEPNAEGLYRLVEGIAIYRAHPGSKLVLSGAGYDHVSYAQLSAQIAEKLGVPATDIITQNISHDTEQEVPLLAKIVGHAKFVVVTSAVHMPRTMELFHRLHLQPVAAPTAYLLRCCNYPDWWKYPDATNLELSAAAMHEYFGVAWIRFKELF